jgi:hypothetical protein
VQSAFAVKRSVQSHITISDSGLEQAGDTQVPSVCFCRSLPATLQHLQRTFETDNPPAQQATHNGEVVPEDAVLRSRSREVVSLLNAATVQQRLGPTLSSQPYMLHDGTHDSSATDTSQSVQSTGVPTSPHVQTVWSRVACNGQTRCVKLLAHPYGSVSWGTAVRQQIVNESFSQLSDTQSQSTSSNSDYHLRQLQTTACQDQSTAAILMAVGPEGGWLDAELDMFLHEYGYSPVQIAAGRVLDTHSATVALCSLAAESSRSVQTKLAI